MRLFSLAVERQTKVSGASKLAIMLKHYRKEEIGLSQEQKHGMKPSEFQTQNQFQGSALIELGAAQQVLHLPSFLRVADTLSWYVALAPSFSSSSARRRTNRQ